MIKRETRQPASVPVLRADDPAGIARAIDLLRGGGLVAFPTDTVYGLGVDARQAEAVRDIYAAKRRPPEKAIPLLVASILDALPFVSTIPDRALPLIEAFWPGGLTLILPIAKGVPAIISPGPGIAVRMPDHPVPLELIRRLGAPLAATSANASGSADPTVARDVLRQLDRRIDLIIDGGSTPGRRASTVVDLTTNPERVLRSGPISASMLRRFLPDLEESL